MGRPVNGPRVGEPRVFRGRAVDLVETLRGLAPQRVDVVATIGFGAPQFIQWCGDHLQLVDDVPAPAPGSVTVLMGRYPADDEAGRHAALSGGAITVTDVSNVLHRVLDGPRVLAAVGPFDASALVD